MTYSLLEPVFAFRENSRDVVRLPAGALITLMLDRGRTGICAASWEGNRIMVFCQDVEDHGVRTEASGAIG